MSASKSKKPKRKSSTGVGGHDLFSALQEPNDEPAHGHDSKANSLVDAERLLLDLADYVYAHTSLKPISKTLFLISRCLCVAKLGGGASDATELRSKYAKVRAGLNGAAPGDDFDFPTVVEECEPHISRVLDAINNVCRLTDKIDGLGLVFNTLLRGKFEGGEGMGTFLTPEEVVFPMVDMLIKAVDKDALGRLDGTSPLLYGDICGGTGRFVYALTRRLESLEFRRRQLEKTARLFDQSLMAVDLGTMNFLFEGMRPTFERVGDSLIDPQVSKLKSRFLFLATNPPFGSNKYRWNKALAETLPYEVLAEIGIRGSGDAADPSELFFFRNLDLLAPGGALAIVLPDGIVQSENFKKAISVYGRIRKVHPHVAAVVSLPCATFALGGTVAKTSFLIIQKQERPKNEPMYVALAHHVGFLKRGNRRANDPHGNDLIQIATEFMAVDPLLGKITGDWKDQDDLSPARLIHSATQHQGPASQEVLGDLAKVVRQYQNGDGRNSDLDTFHVSILDVDTTGLIDIVTASLNRPMSKGISCKPGDILVSCINPKIWRTTVIPNIAGRWSCSPEFLVLRPNRLQDSWAIAVALHSPSVAQAVQAMAKGTSSSRQRVPKEGILTLAVPRYRADAVNEHATLRETIYLTRLREARAYDAVHQGQEDFVF